MDLICLARTCRPVIWMIEASSRLNDGKPVGQAFGPMEESEVGKAVAIGRMLKKRALSGKGG